MWKNKSLLPPVSINPKPFSVTFLIVPSAIFSQIPHNKKTRRCGVARQNVFGLIFRTSKCTTRTPTCRVHTAEVQMKTVRTCLWPLGQLRSAHASPARRVHWSGGCQNDDWSPLSPIRQDFGAECGGRRHDPRTGRGVAGRVHGAVRVRGLDSTPNIA